MSALDTLEEIKNMKPLDKLVRKYMWGHHVNGTFYFHGDPKLDEARKELAALRTRIAELEADALARLVEEPTNERIMKDVYDENERLKKVNYILVDAVKVALQVWGSAMYPQTTAILESAIKEYGGEE